MARSLPDPPQTSTSSTLMNRIGHSGVQTWMDATISDRVVTPHHGKPVEVQALWHNAAELLRATSP